MQLCTVSRIHKVKQGQSRKYGSTRKSNPFHRFLNGLTVSTLGSIPLTFHLGRILQLFCSITWISVFMLRKRWNLPLNLPYLRTSVPIFWVPLMIPPTIWGPTDPFPFLGPQPLRPSSKTFSWGCPVRRSGDIVLYLICVLPTARLLLKLSGHILQRFTQFFIGLKLFWLTKNQFKINF